MTEIYSLTVPEASVQTEVVAGWFPPGAVQENPFRASSSFWWPLAILGVKGLING